MNMKSSNQKHTTSDNWTYDELLEYGKILIWSYMMGDKSIDNTTGLEYMGSLYTRKLYDINNYMFTTGSTNDPYRLFQPMWITGYLPYSKSIELAEFLYSKNISYIIQNDITKYFAQRRFVKSDRFAFYFRKCRINAR